MIATRLAEIRSARGMTQQDLASGLGVSRTSVSAVENGRVEAWPKFRRDAAAILAVAEEKLFPSEPTARLELALVWSSRTENILLSRLASALLIGNLDEEQSS